MHHSLKKLLFCYQISSDTGSFFRLLANSKRLRWSKKDKSFKDEFPYVTSGYQLNLADKKHNVSLRTYTGDLDIFYEIFYREVYKLNKAVFDNAETIIDLGSNTGLSALYFLSKCPRSKIICAEPDPENFNILSGNLSPFRDSGRAYLHEAAVMAEAGRVYLKREKVKYNSNVLKDSEEKNTEAITINNLIDLYDIERISLIKIDIEGSEKYLFSSGTEWLSKTDHIIVEFHSEEDRKVVVTSLHRNDFEIVFSGDKEGDCNLLFASAKGKTQYLEGIIS